MRLSPEESRARFSAAPVARFASTSADGIPHLVPITFAVLAGDDGTDRVVFVVDDKPKSTRYLRRLANIAAQPRVCVLVDRYEDDWDRLWWARADGTAALHDAGDALTDPAIDALAARYPAYVRQRPPGPVVSIAVERWSGWAAADVPG